MNSKFDVFVFVLGLILILAFGVFIATHDVYDFTGAEPLTMSTQYAKSGTVIHVDSVRDVVVFVDVQGNEWSFTGAEDWQEGDSIACIMDTQGTATQYDDAVVCATYQGYAE